MKEVNGWAKSVEYDGTRAHGVKLREGEVMIYLLR